MFLRVHRKRACVYAIGFMLRAYFVLANRTGVNWRSELLKKFKNIKLTEYFIPFYCEIENFFITLYPIKHFYIGKCNGQEL